MKLTRLEIAVIIGVFMVMITINAVWRVRVMGAAERYRVEQAALAEAGTDAGDPSVAEDAGTD